MIFDITSNTIDLETHTVPPCELCGGACCKSGVMFSESEIVTIRNNYNIRFTEKETSIPKSFTLTKRGNPNKDKCIFYDKEIGCTIYEHRPKVCKDFGSKLFMQCPFVGFTKIPKKKKSIEEFMKRADDKSIEFMTVNINEIKIGQSY